MEDENKRRSQVSSWSTLIWSQTWVKYWRDGWLVEFFHVGKAVIWMASLGRGVQVIIHANISLTTLAFLFSKTERKNGSTLTQALDR